MKDKLVKILSIGLLVLGMTMVGAAAVQSPVLAGSDQYNLKSGIETGNSPETPDSLFDESDGIFKTVINVLLFLIGAISVIMIIYGGIRYVTSGGDQGAVTSAKNTILYAVVGLVVAILAYAIVNFVVDAFGVGD